MVRLLVANGCSLTRGQELTDPDTQAWPSVLGNRLGVPNVNLARDGSSNRRIVRSTISRLGSACQQFAVEPKETQVILVWSQSARHEYYSRKEAPEVWTGPPDHPDDLYWQRVAPWRQNSDHGPTDAFYDHLWSEDGQIINFFIDWVLLDRYLKYEGYQVGYAFGFPIPAVLPEPALQYAHQLNGAEVWGGLPFTPGNSLLEAPARIPRAPGGHPSAEGHKWFAATLAEWFRW